MIKSVEVKALKILECCGLVKTYGRTKAVDGLSFSVEKGEVLGFLGPNGAGKTTTIKMILGLTRPSGGRCSSTGTRRQVIPLKLLISIRS